MTKNNRRELNIARLLQSWLTFFPLDPFSFWPGLTSCHHSRQTCTRLESYWTLYYWMPLMKHLTWAYRSLLALDDRRCLGGLWCFAVFCPYSVECSCSWFRPDSGSLSSWTDCSSSSSWSLSLRWLYYSGCYWLRSCLLRIDGWSCAWESWVRSLLVVEFFLCPRYHIYGDFHPSF